MQTQFMARSNPPQVAGGSFSWVIGLNDVTCLLKTDSVEMLDLDWVGNGARQGSVAAPDLLTGAAPKSDPRGAHPPHLREVQSV